MAEKKDSEKEGSKISNVEWWMAISFLGVIDLTQWALDLIGIPLLLSVGAVANRFITFATGLAWPTYLRLRGVNATLPRIIIFLITFFLEEIPTLDSLPFWFLDGIFMMLSVKAVQKLKEKTGIDAEKVAAAIENAASRAKGAGTATDEEGEEDNDTSAEEDGKRESDSGESGKEDDENEDKRVIGKSGGLEVRAAEGGDIYTMDENELAAEAAGEDGKWNTSEKDDDKQKQKKGEKRQGTRPGQNLSSHKEDARGEGEEYESEEGGNSLNLRGKGRGNGSLSKEMGGAGRNFLDLSLSYGDRKKQAENKEEEASLSE